MTIAFILLALATSLAIASSWLAWRKAEQYLIRLGQYREQAEFFESALKATEDETREVIADLKDTIANLRKSMAESDSEIRSLRGGAPQEIILSFEEDGDSPPGKSWIAQSTIWDELAPIGYWIVAKVRSGWSIARSGIALMNNGDDKLKFKTKEEAIAFCHKRENELVALFHE